MKINLIFLTFLGLKCILKSQQMVRVKWGQQSFKKKNLKLDQSNLNNRSLSYLSLQVSYF